jgi:hypothetical protein
MRSFSLSRDMLNIRGQFYPTGYIVASFPSEQAARDAAKAVAEAGTDPDEIYLLTPEVVMGEIAHTVGNAGIPLPSAGTEADTVRRFVELAAQGHYTLMIPSPDREHKDPVTSALERAAPAYAQKYRSLVIEDLV